MNLLEHLAKAIEDTGHVVERRDSSLLVKPIDVIIECEVGERKGFVLTISIKAIHQILFPGGIWDCLAGLGEDDDTAFGYASAVWAEGVFSVIHEVFVPVEKANAEIPRLDMVSRSADNLEFASKLYLGPIQGMGAYQEHADNLKQFILVQKLADAISGEMHPLKVLWIKSFVCKMPDGSVISECRLNNQDWAAGASALYHYAQEWKEIQEFAGLKQFVMIVPCQWHEIHNAEKLKAAVQSALS